MRKKLVVFGGSFNPPLISHFLLAQQIINKYFIDKVIFVPVNSLYQKAGLVENRHRYEMLKRVCDHNQKFEVSTVEIDCDRQLYTIETLEKIQEQNPKTQIYFVVGTDNLKELETWKQPEQLLKNYTVVVIERKEDNAKQIIQKNELLKQYENKFLIITDSPTREFSSTKARQQIQKGNSIRYMTPDEIYFYIQEQHLYEGK